MALPFDVDWRSFWLGFAALAIPGFLVFMFSIWNPPTPSPFKPQMVVLPTKKTPWQVVMGWAGSMLMLVGFGVAIAVVLIIALFNAALPEVIWWIVVAVVSFVAGFFARQLFG